MNNQSKKVKFCVTKRAALKNNRAYLLRTEITKSHLNNHICQYCGMKTMTATPSFYFVFNIALYYNDSISSFIGNLCRELLLRNHLKPLFKTSWLVLNQLKYNVSNKKKACRAHTEENSA